jgi:hypothetical protein
MLNDEIQETIDHVLEDCTEVNDFLYKRLPTIFERLKVNVTIKA